MIKSVKPKNIIINKKKGIFFWITGFSGAGKTAIAKKIKPKICKFYGPTILFSGPSGTQPGSMSGTIDSNNAFTASNRPPKPTSKNSKLKPRST